MEDQFYQESEMVNTELSESPMMSEEDTRNMINNYQQTISSLGSQIKEIEVKKNNLQDRHAIMKAKVISNQMTVDKQKEMELFFKEEIPTLQVKIAKLLKKLQVQNQIHTVGDIGNIQIMNSSFENFKEIQKQEFQRNQNKRLSLPLKIEKNIQHIQGMNQQIVDSQMKEFKQTQEMIKEVKEGDDYFDNEQVKVESTKKVEQQQQNQDKQDQEISDQMIVQSINSLQNIDATLFLKQQDLDNEKESQEKQIKFVIQNFSNILDASDIKFLEKLSGDMGIAVVENKKLGIEKQIKINEAILINEKQKEEQKDNMILKDCINCRNKYSPLCNNEESCQYHSGQLRFYSCMKCGADEYYNCCNSCINCNPGCMQRKHACTL